ncbi:MAG: hypothetical protein LBC87_10435 [Fibromonadaceae bacterium]|jgi:hypothetical protein|nr:hypothetical protein [Fibromonadaceae bacterium]
MSNTTTALSYDKIFNEIAEECREKEIFSNSEEIKPNKKKPRFCRLQRTSIHYELQHYDLAGMVGIEIHIEKKSYGEKNDYSAKKEKVELLQRYLKYLTDVKIFGKQIMYDPCWYNCGRIYLLCDYSMGKEKILCYINEFIYQTRERINIIVPNWD